MVKVKSLEKQLRLLKGGDTQTSLNFANLCIFLDSQISPEFKWLELEKYEGNLVPTRIFTCIVPQRSNMQETLSSWFKGLTGPALSWYTRLVSRKIDVGKIWLACLSSSLSTTMKLPLTKRSCN